MAASPTYTVYLAGYTNNSAPGGDNLIAYKEVNIFDTGAISFTNAAGRTIQLTDCPYEFISLLKQLVATADATDLSNGAVPLTKKWRDAG